MLHRPTRGVRGTGDLAILKRVDEQPVWSIVCSYVAKTARRSGLIAALLRGAVEYARQQEVRIV